MRAFYACLLTTNTTQFDRLIDLEQKEKVKELTALSIAEAHTKVTSYPIVYILYLYK